ncbi:MAG: hypothetical protein ISP92_02155 [Pseudomonadales bacterium]|jgi:hypothetical protein|nr:hypothetical protein [Pseudomonadales bacterium]MDA0760229.1 hypothetical protein [Pseudomonadota bacterium]MDA0958713.1 hypothetical protein [Pseudomonadota bacterium]MDA1207367.1 hypothetical protein [Pseudomonadota bacterium]
MSQIPEAKIKASEILAGLRKLGPNRVVALSTHKTKALVAELELKAEALVKALDDA